MRHADARNAVDLSAAIRHSGEIFASFETFSQENEMRQRNQTSVEVSKRSRFLQTVPLRRLPAKRLDRTEE